MGLGTAPVPTLRCTAAAVGRGRRRGEGTRRGAAGGEATLPSARLRTDLASAGGGPRGREPSPRARSARGGGPAARDCPPSRPAAASGAALSTTRASVARDARAHRASSRRPPRRPAHRRRGPGVSRRSPSPRRRSARAARAFRLARRSEASSGARVASPSLAARRAARRAL